MIDFSNATFVKLNQVDPSVVMPTLGPLLLDGEDVLIAAKGIRDFVAFTPKRILVVNVQGITGKKQDTTSLPYSKIQTFAVETAGTFDRDSELDLWFSGLGQVRLEFGSSIDIRYIAKLIGWAVLS